MTNNNDELEKLRYLTDYRVNDNELKALQQYIDHYAEQRAREVVVAELEFLDTCPPALIYVGIADRIKEWKAK